MRKGKTVFLRFDYKKSRWLIAAADKNEKLKDYLESEYLWMTATNFPDNNEVWFLCLSQEARKQPIFFGPYPLSCSERENMKVEKEFFDAFPSYNDEAFANEIIRRFEEDEIIRNYLGYQVIAKRLKKIDSKSPVFDIDYCEENRKISKKIKDFYDSVEPLRRFTTDPIQDGETENQTIGCRCKVWLTPFRAPKEIGYYFCPNELDCKVCALLREDHICLAPLEQWKDFYKKEKNEVVSVNSRRKEK